LLLLTAVRLGGVEGDDMYTVESGVIDEGFPLSVTTLSTRTTTTTTVVDEVVVDLLQQQDEREYTKKKREKRTFALSLKNWVGGGGGVGVGVDIDLA